MKSDFEKGKYYRVKKNVERDTSETKRIHGVSLDMERVFSHSVYECVKKGPWDGHIDFRPFHESDSIGPYKWEKADF